MGHSKMYCLAVPWAQIFVPPKHVPSALKNKSITAFLSVVSSQLCRFIMFFVVMLSSLHANNAAYAAFHPPTSSGSKRPLYLRHEWAKTHLQNHGQCMMTFFSGRSSKLFSQLRSGKESDLSHLTPVTNAVLNITYDGSHFHGWSAANDDTSLQTGGLVPEDVRVEERKYEYSSRPNGADFLPPLLSERKGSRGRRRRRGSRIPGITKVRSVEGQIRQFLAKLYGNVDPKLVQVEGCSRTDKGVHARGMIALFYCLSDEFVGSQSKSEGIVHSLDSRSTPVPGKKTPHPASRSDASSFVPLPCGGDVDKIMFCLNRMLPPDVRVNSISPTPLKRKGSTPFHPTLDAILKTYRYTFSIGHVHDPMRWRHVWHIENVDDFDIKSARELAEILVGKHDFVAFRGAFRGSDRGRVQDTVCTLSDVIVELEGDDTIDSVEPLGMDGFEVGGRTDSARERGFQPLKTFTVTISGDRFLYKMVRFLVGAIVSAGLGNVSLSDVHRALDTGCWNDATADSKQQRVCAPSHGLVLTTVRYPDELNFQWVKTNRRD